MTPYKYTGSIDDNQALALYLADVSAFIAYLKDKYDIEV